MNAHILIVEDERKLASNIASYLEAFGFRTTMLHDGQGVVAAVSGGGFDAVLLDWLLPDVDGLTLCQALRRQCAVPIIMMTARVEESDRIDGLDAGADDYLCKPFSLREMTARLRALLRRAQMRQGKPSTGLHIDDAAHRVFVDSDEVTLTPVEYRLLKIFHANPGRAFTRYELQHRIYTDCRIVNDRTINVHVKNLRQKLVACGFDDPIATIHGIGYRWS
ncbi:response regulator [Propionivibrio limicola]|uniref:response regulator n=1 Tax=Propionivibrio limicola TaxID=167645 RepID=UPI0012914848|nr:response regulator [Propionivibrio limicola]